MDRLLLVRHATTSATRRACFPATSGAYRTEDCEPLDRVGRQAAEALGARLPGADHCWSSFAERAMATARLAGFTPEPSADLADCDFGRWAGLTVPQVGVESLSAWYADPDVVPHGGESFADVRARAAKLLLRARDAGGTIIAVSHGGLVTAALVEALGLPSVALWRLDVAPASVTELHPAVDGWRVVRLNWTEPSWRTGGSR